MHDALKLFSELHLILFDMDTEQTEMTLHP